MQLERGQNLHRQLLCVLKDIRNKVELEAE